MKKILIVSLVILAFGCRQKDIPLVQANTDLNIDFEKEKLRYLKEVEWPKAYREQDTVLLARILGDDFQMIDNSGLWSNKIDELDWIKHNSVSYDSFYYEIKRLEVFNNGTAIISGTGHMFDDTTKGVYQSSNILINRNGIWKAVSSHVSGVKTVE